MPQMAPIWWLTLMMIFIMTLIILMILNFYLKDFKYNKNIKFNMNQMTWLW